MKHKELRIFQTATRGWNIRYMWRAPSTRSWEKEVKAGRCNKVQRRFWTTKPPEELYDTTVDPWEVKNLASAPKYAEVLERMRKATAKWVRDIRDPGFMPEGEMIERTRGTTSFEYVRSDTYPYERIIDTAEIATMRDETKLPELIKRMDDRDSAVRFWAATGCIVLGDKAKPAADKLLKMLDDPSPDVRIAAGEAVYNLGMKEEGLAAIKARAKGQNSRATLHARNVLDCLGQGR